MADERRRVVPLVCASVFIAVVFAFWDAIGNLWFRWFERPELSHSVFLPLVSMWMLWERKNSLLPSLGAPNIWGFVPVAASLFLLFLGSLTHIFVLSHVGFVVLLMALPFLFGGRSFWLITLIPLGYLFFMVPPPYWVITRLTGEFQLMSSQLGVAMIRLFDIPVFLSGNVIRLPSQSLEVAEACSGLNYLFPFMSLGGLAAYFYKGPMWQRAIIFFSTIPITIVMNSFRIALTGVLVERVPGNHTDGFLHFFEGYTVFILCILFLMGIIWVLTLIRGRKNPLAFVGFEEVPPVTPTGTWSQPAFVRHALILIGALLVVGIAVQGAAKRSHHIPERTMLAELPLEFGGWQTRESILDPEIATTLGADDYIVSDMVAPNGDVVNVYIAYLDRQRDGRSWHSPLQCLPGGGWEIVEREILSTTRRDGREYKYNRMIIRENNIQMLVYYWYDQRGRKIANEFVMKFALMWDALIRQRSDGAMVRLMTPIFPDETETDAEARLERMRLTLEPKLPKYIPH